MPIRPEFRHFYGREWRTVTRPRILARAGNRCEQCLVPNHRGPEDKQKRIGGAWLEVSVAFGRLPVTAWRDSIGRALRVKPLGLERTVRIVLTIAHRNHIPGDDRDENLTAMCQWCHLHYDQLHHHETRAARKDASRPLLSHPLKNDQPPTKEAHAS